MAGRWRVDGSAGIWLVRGDARTEAHALRGEALGREAAAARVDAWFPSGWGDEGTATLAAIGRALAGGFPGEGVPEAAWLKRTLRRALLDGQVTAVRARVTTPAQRDEPETPPEPGPRRPVKQTTWVEIRILDDETGRPVEGIALQITVPGQSADTYTTGADGRIRIEDIDAGSCHVESDLRGARLENTVSFVDFAIPAGAEAGKPPLRGHRHLAEIEAHRVKTGETLDGLARGAGMTWKELARFNFGVESPEAINEHLREVVGCRKKTADGANYVFDSADDPGIIFIPRPFSRSRLETTKVHVLRVRRLAHAERHVWIEVHHALGLHASEPYTLRAGGKTIRGTTTAKGVVEATVPAIAIHGTLEIGGASYALELVSDKFTDEIQWAQIRLNNLGFACGRPDGIWGEKSKRAMRLFQAKHRLPPTGEPDGRSLARLGDEHDLADDPQPHGPSAPDDEDDYIPEDDAHDA